MKIEDILHEENKVNVTLSAIDLVKLHEVMKNTSENCKDDIFSQLHSNVIMMLDALLHDENYEEGKSDNPLTFRMCGDIRFNRPIMLEGMPENGDGNIISLGGFNMLMDNKNVQFDFTEAEMFVYPDDPRQVHFELKNPDYDYIMVNGKEDCITEKMLKNVQEISDFFVYLGEDETDLRPEKLVQISFYLPYENFKGIAVSKNVCKNAKIGY